MSDRARPGPVRGIGARWLLCGVLTALAAASAGAQPTQPPPGGDAPVIYRGREVFTIHRGVGTISAAERASLVSRRLDGLVHDLSFDPARLTVEDRETYSELVHGDRVLGVITDDDATAVGRPRPEYARQVRDRLVEIVTTTREEFSAAAIAIGIAWAALATLVGLLLLRLLMRLGRQVQTRVQAWYQRLTNDPRVGRAAARRATRVGAMVHGTVRLATVAGAVALAALWVQVVLQVLPWSRPLARQIYRYSSAPIRDVWLGFVSFVPSLFFIAVIALTAFVVLRIVQVVFREIAEGNVRFASFPEDWAEPTYKLVRVLVVAVALVAAFPYLPGSQSPAFQGIALFAGLLVSLASSSALSNIIAGIILTYTRAFKLGDVVRIGQTLGEVTDKRLLVTRVRTPKNEVVSIPNSLILATQVLNYTTLAAERGLIIHTPVTIGYDAPWRKIHELLTAAALRTDGVLKDPSPFVLQTALNDFSVSYEVNAFVSSPFSILRIYSALHANIQECFNEAGVEIMSPNYYALRDGNRVTIPRPHLPGDYEPPSFRVRYRAERHDANTPPVTRTVESTPQYQDRDG